MNAPQSKKQYLEHAKLHLATAQKQLEYAESAEGDDWAQVCSIRSIAESRAGMLALELAKYNGAPGYSGS